MKTNILVVFLLLLNLSLHSQWDAAFYQHEGYRINDVWVFDSDNFIVAGDYGWSSHIYSTTDGGESYYVFTFDDWIQTFFFVNDTLGYAGGNDNYGIYKTYDKGRTWRFVDSETFFLDTYYMYFFSETIGIIDNKWTHDGGLSFHTGEYYIHDVLKVSDSVSFACCYWPVNGIIKTEDNGLSWELVHDSIFASDLIEVDPNHNILLSEGVLYHSYDLFQSFEDTTYIQDYTGNRMFVDFADSLNGFMVTYSTSNSTPRMKVFASQDGGYSWFHTDLIYGSQYWSLKNPIHCLPNQTFITTSQTLLRSPEGSIGPIEAVKPIKPRSLAGMVIPATKARNIEIQSDSAGNIYAACTFEGQLEIGDTTINHSWNGSLLYAKLDKDFNIIWLHTFGSEDYFSVPFSLHVFKDGSSVIHLNLTGEYYIDSEGPHSNGPVLFHYDQNGLIIDQLSIDGYIADQNMEGDNISKVFLGGLTTGTISIEGDSLTGPLEFLLLWDVESGNYELKPVAHHYGMFGPGPNITMAYDIEHDMLSYSAIYQDSILIENQKYYAIHQDTGSPPNYWYAYYLVKISAEGSIVELVPNICETRLGYQETLRDYIFLQNDQTAILGVQRDTLYHNGIYYTPEQGERSFIIHTEDMGGASGFTYLGGKPWGIQAYQAISFQEYLIINTHQEFKTPFGNDKIINSGNMYKDDNVFLFYDSDLNYTGYYQLIDQYYDTDIEVIGDRLFLGGSSYDNAIEFENEIFYNDGESYYYIAELDFQYLYIDEPTKTKMNTLYFFPNPSNGRIQIAIPSDCSYGSLEVYSISGQLMLSQELSGEDELDLFIDEVPGIYLIKLSDGQEYYTGKCMILK